MGDQFWSILPILAPESPLLMSSIFMLPESKKKECVLDKNVGVNCEEENMPILSQPQLENKKVKIFLNMANPLLMVGLNSSELQFVSLIDQFDLDVPIAFRKCVRSCT